MGNAVGKQMESKAMKTRLLGRSRTAAKVARATPLRARDRDRTAPAGTDQTTAGTDQTTADSDQTAADSDQTAADSDQTAAERDQAYAEGDQRASDRDQASADRDKAAYSVSGEEVPEAYEVSRIQREAGTFSRFLTSTDRARSAYTRNRTASRRDGTAAKRDEAARKRDARDEEVDRAIAASNAPLARKLECIREMAAAERARAAADRERAAQERAEAAAERARLELEVNSSHLDALTGAYRREMGDVALSHEVDRARRSDGRFVLAFVDVDGLKIINDRDGHAAGDHVLQVVVKTIRSNLRSFDPVVRFGGDEFVCGLGGTGIDEARRRFDAIAISVTKEAGVGISVGLAELEEDESPDHLTARADAALLEVKATHSHR